MEEKESKRMSLNNSKTTPASTRINTKGSFELRNRRIADGYQEEKKICIEGIR